MTRADDETEVARLIEELRSAIPETGPIPNREYEGIRHDRKEYRKIAHAAAVGCFTSNLGNST
jgi:hypothetical protein